MDFFTYAQRTVGRWTLTNYSPAEMRKVANLKSLESREKELIKNIRQKGSRINKLQKRLKETEELNGELNAQLNLSVEKEDQFKQVVHENEQAIKLMDDDLTIVLNDTDKEDRKIRDMTIVNSTKEDVLKGLKLEKIENYNRMVSIKTNVESAIQLFSPSFLCFRRQSQTYVTRLYHLNRAVEMATSYLEDPAMQVD